MPWPGRTPDAAQSGHTVPRQRTPRAVDSDLADMVARRAGLLESITQGLFVLAQAEQRIDELLEERAKVTR